jgi:exopolysaccharide/PEP-CTERM locus tyrosine autokinase
MSRIEQALEKAARQRESTKEIASGTASPAPESGPSVSFVPAEGGVIDPTLVDGHIVSIVDPSSLAAEQYRKLRAGLLKKTRSDGLNTLMIASAGAQEGKTVTAINLAVTLAQELDHTVLLVDADLRNPSINKYLGINPEYGLGDCLMNQARIQDVLVKTGVGKLVLLPAGRPVENPAELLASDMMRSLVSEVKHRYRDRYIIFDSAPLLLAADGLSLAGYMDGIILVVQADVTSAKAAKAALDQLKGYTVLGSVLSSVSARDNKGMGGYYLRYKGRYQMGHSRQIDGVGKGTGPKTD